MTPARTVKSTNDASAGRSCSIFVSSDEAETGEDHVDDLDPDEGRDDAAEPVDEEVVAQQGRRADGTLADAPQRERDQRDDDERVEDHRGQDRTLGGLETHDVQPVE